LLDDAGLLPDNGFSRIFGFVVPLTQVFGLVAFEFIRLAFGVVLVHLAEIAKIETTSQ
jgi:hypothetical protein